MPKTLDDARQTIQISQALIARNEELRSTLAETLDLYYRNHDEHESLRQDGTTLRQKAKKLARKL